MTARTGKDHGLKLEQRVVDFVIAELRDRRRRDRRRKCAALAMNSRRGCLAWLPSSKNHTTVRACRSASFTPMKCNDQPGEPKFGNESDVARRGAPAATSPELRISQWYRGGLLGRRGGDVYADAPLSGERLRTILFGLRNLRADDPSYGHRAGRRSAIGEGGLQNWREVVPGGVGWRASSFFQGRLARFAAATRYYVRSFCRFYRLTSLE